MTTLEHDCGRFAGEVARSIETAAELSDESVREARRCPRCVRVLDAVVRVANAPAETIAPPVEATASALGAAAARMTRRRRLSIGLRLALCVGAFGALIASGIGRLGAHALAQESVSALVVLVLWLLASIDLDRGSRPARLHARWDGRMLQGVCVGIAEYFALPVWLVRVVFIAWAIAGSGVVAYLVLSGVVELHPDDRRHWLRFRIRRAWQRWRARRARSAVGAP